MEKLPEKFPVWLKRICKVPIEQEELETINFPRLEYYRYISFKTAEYFSVIGLIIGARPDKDYKRYTLGLKNRSTKMKVLVGEIGRGGRSWMLLGLSLSPLISVFMIHGLKMSEIYKICYKLRQDENAIRRDRWAMNGAVSGMTTGLLSGLVFGLHRAAWCGMVVGTSVGCLSALAFSAVFGEKQVEDD